MKRNKNNSWFIIRIFKNKSLNAAGGFLVKFSKQPFSSQQYLQSVTNILWKNSDQRLISSDLAGFFSKERKKMKFLD